MMNVPASNKGETTEKWYHTYNGYDKLSSFEFWQLLLTKESSSGSSGYFVLDWHGRWCHIPIKFDEFTIRPSIK